MKDPKKKDVIDLTVQPFPFRRAPELDGKLKSPPEKLVRANEFLKKFGLPPHE